MNSGEKYLLLRVIKKAPSTLIICIGLICAVYLIIGLIYRPIIFNDAIHGYISLHNYLAGGGWNKLLYFNNNASELDSQNLTWRAPGQYELPYLTAKLFNCNIGVAISILSFISITCGSYFYCKIFEISSLPKSIILIALLILLLQRFINISFILFSSSDLFLFLYTPLYVYTYLKAKDGVKYYWLNLIAFLFINLLGLFIKNGFLLFSTAYNFYLIIDLVLAYRKSKKQIAIIPLIKRATIIAPYLISVVLVYWFFLRLGSNPTSGAGFLINFPSLVSGAFQGSLGVFFSALSVTAVYGNVQGKLTSINPYVTVLMLLFLVILAFLIYQNRRNIKTMLKTDGMFRLIFIISIMYIIYWIVFTLKQSYISNEDRLFLPVTILVFPYLINYTLKANKFVKYVAFVIIFLSVVYGGSTMYYRIITYSSDSMSANSADNELNGFKLFTHQTNEVAQLNVISRIISKSYQNEKIITTDPDGLFLLNLKNQYITTGTVNIPVVIRDHKKYLLLVSKTEKVNLEGWRSVYTSDNYVLYLSN